MKYKYYKRIKEPEDKIKNGMIKTWCNNMNQIFMTYKYKKIRSPILLPLHTCNVLIEFGLMDKKLIEIDNIPIHEKSQYYLNAIYSTFDKMNNEGNELKTYLATYENKYTDSDPMPFNY